MGHLLPRDSGIWPLLKPVRTCTRSISVPNGWKSSSRITPKLYISDWKKQGRENLVVKHKERLTSPFQCTILSNTKGFYRPFSAGNTVGELNPRRTKGLLPRIMALRDSWLVPSQSPSLQYQEGASTGTKASGVRGRENPSTQSLPYQWPPNTPWPSRCGAACPRWELTHAGPSCRGWCPLCLHTQQIILVKLKTLHQICATFPETVFRGRSLPGRIWGRSMVFFWQFTPCH